MKDSLDKETLDRDLMLWSFNKLCGFNVAEIREQGIPRKLSKKIVGEEQRFTKGLCMIYRFIAGID